MQVVIGAHRILPEIEQALVGMSIDATKTTAAKFPDDYGAESVAGKQAEFRSEDPQGRGAHAAPDG
jgi:trigger factor